MILEGKEMVKYECGVKGLSCQKEGEQRKEEGKGETLTSSNDEMRERRILPWESWER